MTKKPIALPEVSARWMTPEGKPTVEFYQWLKEVDRVLRLVVDFVDTPVIDPDYVLVEPFPAFIAFPSDKSYTLVLKASTGFTITETVTKCVSGTCTATFKINTTALGGTANSVSSSEQAQAHASANVVAVDDDVVVTISANADCRDLSLTINTTRTLTS